MLILRALAWFRLTGSGRILGVVVVSLAIGGCGGLGRTLPPGRGVVAGQIYADVGLCGSNGCGPRGGLVTVFEPSGRVVAHELVRNARGFSFVLPAGRYELELATRLLTRAACAPPSEAVVRPGQTTRINVHASCGVL